MANEPTQHPALRVNRRELLGTAAALIGGAVVGVAGNALPEEAPQPSASGVPATGPNVNPPIVQVKGGTLRGLREGKTSSFLGIRYADAERFGPPRPVQAWTGMKNAQAWGPVCPIPAQTSVGADEVVFPHRYWVENEHCQYLNVWTPNLAAAAKKTVMVWMHGGGFTNGSSIESYAYDGRSLSEFGDVVVVSVNHRLNILGTLDLSAYGPQYAQSRYTGTADLLAALQWVHDNIESFGGDPGNVMIFGQSGGGGKVVRMMHMPAAKGLFHKVAAQSGGNNTYRTTDPAESMKTQQTIAAHTLKNLGLTGDQIDKLKTVPYTALIAAGAAALRSAAQELGKPALNWEVIADDQYVMREFCDWADAIPLVAGSVFSEMQGTLTRGDGRKNEWSEHEIAEQLTAAFGDRKNDVVAQFKQLFPRKKIQDVLYYAGGSRPGVKNLLARKLEKARAPVYNYLFAWEYPINGGITSFHCSELAFCFHALNVPQIQTATGGSPVAMSLQDKVAQAWVNFARTGNPNQPELEWKPYTKEHSQAMVFDTVSQSVSLADDKLVSLLPTGGGRGTTAPTGRSAAAPGRRG
jgi:para-nitrobenzyl esterase